MKYLDMHKVETYRKKRKNNKYIRHINLSSVTVAGYIKFVFRQNKNKPDIRQSGKTKLDINTTYGIPLF